MLRHGLSLAEEYYLLFGGQSYIQKIANIQRSNMIALWPQNEGSGTAITDKSPENNTGTYTGVTWDGTKGPDGISPVPFYDGSNDYGNILSTPFKADFSGKYGAIAGWFKVFNAGVWTDAALRYIFRLAIDGTNFIVLNKTITDNQLFFQYGANGTFKTITTTAYNLITWISFIINFQDSANGDAVSLYLNGTQVGTTQSANGAFSATDLTIALLGAGSTVPAQVWNGYLGPIALWKNTILNASDRAAWTNLSF